MRCPHHVDICNLLNVSKEGGGIHSFIRSFVHSFTGGFDDTRAVKAASPTGDANGDFADFSRQRSLSGQ